MGNIEDDIIRSLCKLGEAGGFFSEYQRLKFRGDLVGETIQLLESVDLSEKYVRKEIVAYLWDYQLILIGNAEAVISKGANEDEVNDTISRVEEILSKKLWGK